MPQALVTTKPNQPHTIAVSEFDNENGWVDIGKHFHLLGIWQWLAWNRLRFLLQLIASLGRASGKRVSRRKWERLEERRRDRESLRSYLKHHKHHSCVLFAILVMLWISECRQRVYRLCIVQIIVGRWAQPLKPPPVFLRGLTGFARTDSIVPAVSF